MATRSRTPESLLARITASCPRLTVGERWAGVFGRSDTAEVVAVRESEDVPWALVTTRFEGGVTIDIGAPAYIGARRIG